MPAPRPRPFVARVLALGLAAALGPAAGAQPDCPRSEAVAIEVGDARLRVEIAGAPLAEVLDALAGCVGARLDIRGSITEEIEGTFEAPDLRRLLERMLDRGGYSSVLVLEPGSRPPRVSRILVLSAQGATGNGAGGARQPGPAVPRRAPAPGAVAAGDPDLAARRKRRQMALAVRRKDASASALLTGMLLGDEDPAIREAAAGSLAEFGDPALGAAIAQAVEQERVPAVRYQAIRALGAAGGPLAGRVLLDVLSADADPLARRMAVRSLGRSDGPGAREALALAARQDSAREVREAARLQLEELRRADRAPPRD